MRNYLVGVVSAALAAVACTSPAHAFVSHDKSTAISVTGSGVVSVAVVTVSVVTQAADPATDTAATLGFGTTGGNALLDSGEALKVTVSANIANNRVIIYTDNKNAAASPQFCGVDNATEKSGPANGFDGGGLVGTGADCKKTVPLLWRIFDVNTDHVFTGAAVGDDEVFITDLAHTHTFTAAAIPNPAGATAAQIASRETEREKLDSLVMKNCAAGAASAAIANPNDADADPEVYPQAFGGVGASQDLCNASGAAVTIDPDGAGASGGPKAAVTFQNCTLTPCEASSKVTFAEELSKNIAVVLFGCLGSICNAPNLATAAPDDTITVDAGGAKPVYMPIAGDFRFAEGSVTYAQNTLRLELVSQ